MLYTIKTRVRQAGSHVVIKKEATLSEVFDFLAHFNDEDQDVIVQIYNPKNLSYKKSRTRKKVE
jgi:hypothetical protein